jgi:hypothetical protein
VEKKKKVGVAGRGWRTGVSVEPQGTNDGFDERQVMCVGDYKRQPFSQRCALPGAGCCVQNEVKSRIPIKSEKEWWAPLSRQHRNLTKSEGCKGEEEGTGFDSIWTSI